MLTSDPKKIIIQLMICLATCTFFSCASQQQGDLSQEDDQELSDDQLENQEFDNENIDNNNFNNENFGNDNFGDENLQNVNLDLETQGDDNLLDSQELNSENASLTNNLNSVDEDFENNSFNDDNFIEENAQEGLQGANDLSTSNPQPGVATTSDSNSELTLSPNEANLLDFKAYYGNLLAGHAEGVFMVAVENGKVHLGPHPQFDVVEELPRGTYIHAVKIDKGWVKIGRAKYMRIEDVRSFGMKTRGIEAYTGLIDDQAPPN